MEFNIIISIVQQNFYYVVKAVLNYLIPMLLAFSILLFGVNFIFRGEK